MEKEREVVCGADIHKQFLLATILTKGGQKFQDRFDTNFEGLLNFRQWLLDHCCQRLAVESTANYWLPIYLAVRKDIEFVLANAYQIKHIPGRKTDVLDSEWIAKAVSQGFDSSVSNLLRRRSGFESYDQNQGELRQNEKPNQEQNPPGTRICMHQALVGSFRYLRQVIHIIRGILKGLSIEDILESIPSKKVKARKEEILDAIRAKISLVQVNLIGSFWIQLIS